MFKHADVLPLILLLALLLALPLVLLFGTIRHRKKSWWRMTGSNRRPPACKAGALPAELIPLPLAFDKRRIAALLHRLHSFRYAARFRALRCLLLKAHRLWCGSGSSPVAATLVRENRCKTRRNDAPHTFGYASIATTQYCAGYREPMVGLDGFEPSTPALSRRCSNQLSYRPVRQAS